MNWIWFNAFIAVGERDAAALSASRCPWLLVIIEVEKN
jgi:hypothetical protein